MSDQETTQTPRAQIIAIILTNIIALLLVGPGCAMALEWAQK